MSQVNYRILYFVPNIIGYVRILLLVLSWYYIDTMFELCLIFYTLSVILDAFDGITARLFNQTSTFGAWFDIVIDNVGRGMLWSYVYKWGYFISAFEWLVFVCTHTSGAAWKTTSTSETPSWVQYVMKNNFKTIAGAFAISGLHVLPIWFYLLYNWPMFFLSPLYSNIITSVLIFGRLICACVESWFLWTHIKSLLSVDQS